MDNTRNFADQLLGKRLDEDDLVILGELFIELDVHTVTNESSSPVLNEVQSALTQTRHRLLLCTGRALYSSTGILRAVYRLLPKVSGAGMVTGGPPAAPTKTETSLRPTG